MGSKNNSSDQQCTIHCSFDLHAEAISRAITLRNVSDSAIAAYLNLICSNCGCITDMGRTPLHIAASVGRDTLVKWLIFKKGASVNVKDAESGYTPLHRSILYGQIHVAVILTQLRGDLLAKDNEGLTPLDIATKDRARQINSKPLKNNELYVWGSNYNDTLGIATQAARNHPEALDFFRKQSISLKKVLMEKFHTVFLSVDGEVFACGHARGGRLGVGTEAPVMTPHQVFFESHRLTPLSGTRENMWNKRNICQDVAIGRDHSIFLMEDGLVYSCGLNKQRQLGIVPPQDSVLTPQPINPKLFAANFVPSGVGAGRYHSIIWNSDRIYFVGLNAGQMGARKIEKYFVEPKEDPYFEEKRVRIKSVTCSTATTVVLSTTNIVTVISRFEHRKISLSKFLEKKDGNVRSVDKERTCVSCISVSGGQLEPVDTSSEVAVGDDPILIAVLFDDGILYLWQEQAEGLRRCVFNISRSIQIRSFALNVRKLLLVTFEGEVLEGAVRCFKAKSVSTFANPRPENVNIETIQVRRLPFIHRAVTATCDPTENNYAIIQESPLTDALSSSYIPKGRMALDMAKLLEEASESDPLHDVVFLVGSRRFPAHLYVIARSSDELLQQCMKCMGARGDASSRQVPVVEIEDVHPEVFWTLLMFMYSNSCSLMLEGPCPVWRSKPTPSFGVFDGAKLIHESFLDSSSGNPVNNSIDSDWPDPITETLEVAKRFGLSTLVEKLQQYKVENGDIVKIPSIKNQRLPFKWDRLSHSQFHDVRLKSTDGTIFPAHKCILVARLEYFSIMFLGNWLEACSQEALSLPLQRGVLEIFLEFLYTDKIASLNTHGRNVRSDLAWDLLVAADEFFMPRLKTLAESAIKELLTIQNVVQVLNLAVVYNAEKLKHSCLEFISLNLANLLELRSLDGLSEDLLRRLTKMYQKTMKHVAYRVITPHSEAPTSAEIQSAAEIQPPPWNSPEEFDNISIDSIMMESKKKSASARKKPRVRKSSESGQTVTNLNKSNSSVDFDESLDKTVLSETLTEGNSDIILDLMDPAESVTLDVSPEKENRNPAKEPSSALVDKSRLDSKASPSIPMPNPLFMQKTSSKNVPGGIDHEYPELGQGDRIHGQTRQRTKSERSSSHRMTRLSQKERKRLSSVGESSAPKEEVKQSYCPWEKVSAQVNEDREISLRDIMEKEAIEARKNRKVTPACAIPSTRKVCGSHSPHSWSHVISPGSSPSSVPGQTFPKSGSSSHTDHRLSLSEIIAEENQRKENFFRMRNKPLHLTQLEDKAIDDLSKFYNAHNSYFECITVKRVEYTLMAQPKWIPRPLLSYDNNDSK